jgi:hypothetical protein
MQVQGRHQMLFLPVQQNTFRMLWSARDSPAISALHSFCFFSLIHVQLSVAQVAPTDIEEGMRVGVDRNKYQVGAATCASLIVQQLLFSWLAAN